MMYKQEKDFSAPLGSKKELINKTSRMHQATAV